MCTGNQMTYAKWIPFHKPCFDEDEINEVVDSLRSGWITTGPKTAQFEKDFAGFLGAKYAVALNSGTAALHLALNGIDLKEGDEVITVPFTFVATSEAILYCRAKPVYVDCDPRSFNIIAEKIEEKITKRTKAILPVHFGGQACEMDMIMKVAREHGLKVIEDAAHSFPAKYKGRMVGTIGDITCFSFYATKTLSTGEGGMFVTNNEEYAQRAKMLSLHGISKDAWNRHGKEGSWHYDVIELGRKYNLSDLQASIGIHQLKKANKFLAQRQEIAKAYHQAFDDFDLLEKPYARNFEEHAWHLYVIKLNLEKLGISRDQFMEKMKGEGIGTGVHFIPLHKHPYYKEKFGFKGEEFPNADFCYERIVSLPIYPGMTDDEVACVSEKVIKILEKNRR